MTKLTFTRRIDDGTVHFTRGALERARTLPGNATVDAEIREAAGKEVLARIRKLKEQGHTFDAALKLLLESDENVGLVRITQLDVADRPSIGLTD
jgi:hypothetical protein